MSIESFRGKPARWFFGTPSIIEITADPLLKPLPGPYTYAVFLEKYQLQCNGQGGNVYSGYELIAVYRFGATLVVAPTYRRQGIGRELVYQCIVRSGKRLTSKTRTAATQRLLEGVWQRIQTELNNGG